MKVHDHEIKEASFEDLLVKAEDTATSDWDCQFIDDIRSKFDQYGDEMYLSDLQMDQVKRIASS